MKSPIRAPIKAYSAKYSAAVEKAVAEVIAKIRAGYGGDVVKLMKSIFDKYGIEKSLRDELMKGIVTSISKGASVSISAAQSIAVQRWWVEKAYSPDESKFKERVNDLSRVKEITASVRESVKRRDSWRKAAQDLHDRKIQKPDVAKDITELEGLSRKAFAESNDAQGYAEYKRKIRTVQRRVDKMVDPSTSKLKRAYQDVIDATDLSSARAQANAIKYSAYFKERYNAERIARTEMAGAYGDAFFTENVNDPDAVGWRAELSDAHKVPDICDFHTSADLYGMGPGAYPVGRGPAFPFHPNCTCVLSTVYHGQADAPDSNKIDSKAAQKYLDDLPSSKAVEILGVNGYEDFKANPKTWQSVLKKKGWQGHEKKEARIPLSLLHGKE